MTDQGKSFSDSVMVTIYISQIKKYILKIITNP